MIFLTSEGGNNSFTVDNILSIIAISMSAIAILVTFACLFIQIRSSQKYDSKMKLFTFLVEDVYLKLSYDINKLTFNHSFPKNEVRRIKGNIVDIRVKISFLKYRNEDIYNEIRFILLSLEDSIVNIRSNNKPITERINLIEEQMKKLYSVFDKYFKIDR